MAGIMIYTKTGCPYCQKAVKDYKARGINFKEINISLDVAAKQLVQEKFGAGQVPVIVEDGKLVSTGYSGGG
ncbi:glutaredoxin [Desulfoscipio sp. XC116]|uniref:glutaredoxin n=1 Tax=Desulfoscipio sp. XC116 TaxID=3144975 RepID=UPI00325BB53F